MGCLVLSVGVELELLQLLVLRLLDDNTYLIVVVKLEMRINLLLPQHVLLPDEEVDIRVPKEKIPFPCTCFAQQLSSLLPQVAQNRPQFAASILF